MSTFLASYPAHTIAIVYRSHPRLALPRPHAGFSRTILHVHAAVRVGAVAGAPAAAVRVAVVVRLAVVGLAAALVGAEAAAVEEGEDGGEEEEDAVHDAKGPAGLEHGARLVDVSRDAVDRGLAEDAEADVVRVAAADVGAVGVADPAQVVHAGDEGAHEAQIDEGYEDGVGRRPVVGEQREHGPGEREHRDDEEDQHVGRRQDIGRVPAVDEPGKHAHSRDLLRIAVSRLKHYILCRDAVAATQMRCVIGCGMLMMRLGNFRAAVGARVAQGRKGWLTRVMISMTRQKAKNTANIILATSVIRLGRLANGREVSMQTHNRRGVVVYTEGAMRKKGKAETGGFQSRRYVMTYVRGNLPWERNDNGRP